MGVGGGCVILSENGRAIKKGSRAINRDWANNYASSLPQKIHVLTNLFVSSDNLLKYFEKSGCK